MTPELLRRTFAMLEQSRREHFCADDGQSWNPPPCCPKSDCDCFRQTDDTACTCGAETHNAQLDSVVHDLRLAMVDAAITRCTLWAEDRPGGRSNVVDALVAHKSWLQFEQQIKDLR